MRTLIGVLVAAAVGIHCGAAAEAPEQSASSGVVGSPTSSGGGASSATPHHAAGDSVVTPVPHELIVPGLEALVHGGTPPHVTSTVIDESGSLYATGTFVGDVAIGYTVIRSHGDKDVFLLKLGPAGGFEWIRAVGSGEAETAPRVTLDTDSRVTIVGMTKGEMDCGSGPLQRWASDTFFVCTFGGVDGVSLAGGVFPTGAP